MKNISQLLFCGSLAVTVHGQWTLEPTKGTSLWDITRLTAPTLPAGQTGYWNDQDDFNFTKRVGYAWYFDRICPCQWGCDGRYCTWCANDKRLPEWYGKGKGGKSSAEYEDDLVGVAPEHNMGPLYDCNDPLETGVIINSTSVELDRHNIQVEEFHEYVGLRVDPKHHHAVARAATATASKWSVPKFEIRMIDVIVSANNDLSNNWYRWNQTERDDPRFYASVPIIPQGLKYYDHNLPMWAQTYNRKNHLLYYNTLRFTVHQHDVEVPAGVDVLAYFQVYTQQIRGHVMIDLMMRGREYPVDLAGTIEGPWTNLIHWKMIIPRANYAVWINSGDNDGWNYYYPKVNELLCGGATNPAMCRSHDQEKGRIVNRVRSEWAGYLGPYVNRTLYEWDMSLGENWEERHNRRAISIDVLGWYKLGQGPVEYKFESITPTARVGRYIEKYGLQYNVDYPHLSFA